MTAPTCWTIEGGYLIVCCEDIPIHRECVPERLAGMPRGLRKWAMHAALMALASNPPAPPAQQPLTKEAP